MKLFRNSLLLLAFSLFFIQCKKDEPTTTNAQGDVRLEITDAPIDNDQVSGAFVTIADVRIDGESFPGFSGKQTIDLLAYQNGEVALLGLGEVATGAYSNLTLVLDLETDEDGDSPGCYVLTEDGTRHDLNHREESTSEIQLTGPQLTVSETGELSLVIDFDLRKAIVEENNQSSSGYSFATDAELLTALRLVEKEKTGEVDGTCQNAFLFSDKVIVYAYKKGTFNPDEEVTAQGTSGIRFKNAVSSASVAADGSFSLHFLEAGTYELHFVGYKDADENGTFEVQGSLLLQVAGSLDLTALEVEANTTLSLQVQAAGILPL